MGRRERGPEGGLALLDTPAVCRTPSPSWVVRRLVRLLSSEARQIALLLIYRCFSTPSCVSSGLAFPRPQEADRNAQLSNHRGLYMCRMDLSDLPAHLGLAGLFRSSGSAAAAARARQEQGRSRIRSSGRCSAA